MRNFKDKNLKFELFKTQIIIATLTLIFLAVGLVHFNWLKDKISWLTRQNQELIANNISYSISSWIKDRVLETEKIATLISYANILDDQNTTAIYLGKIYEFSKEFDTVQLFSEDGTIYVGDIGKDNEEGDTKYIRSTNWYQRTKATLSSSVSLVQEHRVLKTQTLNICSAILDSAGKLNAIICGILRTDRVFQKIKNPALNTPNVRYFLASSSGEIISSFGKLSSKNEPDDAIKFINANNAGEEGDYKFDNSKFNVASGQNSKREIMDKKINLNLISQKNGATISKVENVDLFVGVLSDKERILSQNIGELFQKSALFFALFLLLVFTANLLHERWRKKAMVKQRQTEAMLNQSHKMAESGELIASISHQLRQPLNSVSLMISSLLQSSFNEKLDAKMLQASLKLGEKSLKIMDDTITTFRNFYSQKDEISTFKITETIDKISHILHIELSHHNVQVIKNLPKNLNITSYENYTLQILLVLFQNAKEALEAKFGAQSPQKCIFVSSFYQNGTLVIEVSDRGIGVKDEIAKRLFSVSGVTNKRGGSGVGLYIARKIATEKLRGNLYLKHNANPTIFALEIANLKEKND